MSMAEGRFTPEVLLALPRLSDVQISPDGRALAFVVQRRSVDGTKYVGDVHRLEVEGDRAGALQRVTVGETSDSSPRFRHDGSLLFLSSRDDNDPQKKIEGDDDATTQIWQLPRVGEPRPVTRRALGIDAIEIARADASTLVFSSYVFADAKSDAENRLRQKARKESGESSLVWDTLPIRFWDRFHGPRFRHLFALRDDGSDAEARDLTPDARLDYEGVDDSAFDVSPDGRLVVTSVLTFDDEGKFIQNLQLLDVATGTKRALTTGSDSYVSPRFSPDGARLACIFHENRPKKTGRTVLAIIDVSTGKMARPCDALDLWPNAPVWSSDGASVWFTADERGEVPIFCLDVASGRVRRVAIGGGYSDVRPSPDGALVYALFSTFDRPPEVVVCDARATDGKPKRLTHFSDKLLGEITMGKVERLVSKSADGRSVESFFVRAADAKPDGKRPLILWVHGGPIGAWSDHWHWRWNPQVFAARGWNVLLPNPRISLGYGQDFVEEGFARWGAEPYQDLIAAVDEACKRADVDATRTAAMGGSFGGYMANWINGQTTRFKAIVTHASLYHLSAFHGTTDCGPEWEREFGNPYLEPQAYERWSPHAFLAKMKTPTLIIHGEKDYRVPVSEAYMLFTGLQRHGVPSKLLYFPDENHWILKPPNSRVWHETIFEWLDEWL
jgi:dipeptidyl aminopeptidase/acylaminoacyl peptidase